MKAIQSLLRLHVTLWPHSHDGTRTLSNSINGWMQIKSKDLGLVLLMHLSDINIIRM